MSNEHVYELKGVTSTADKGHEGEVAELQRWLRAQRAGGCDEWQVLKPKMRVKRGGGEF